MRSAPKTDFAGVWGDQPGVHIHVIVGLSHLNAFGKGDHACIESFPDSRIGDLVIAGNKKSPVTRIGDLVI